MFYKNTYNVNGPFLDALELCNILEIEEGLWKPNHKNPKGYTWWALGSKKDEHGGVMTIADGLLEEFSIGIYCEYVL